MSEPIRVLQVCQRMEAAGVQSFLMNMYRNIDRTKVQFDFLVHYKEDQFFDDEIKKLGGHIYKFSVREDYHILKYIKELDRFFYEHPEYKIVHGHMDTLGSIYLGRAKKTGIPVRIAHSHNDSVQNGIKKPARLFMISRYKKNATHLFACSEKAGKFMFGNSEYTVFNNAIDTKRFVFDKNIRKKKRLELGIKDNEFVFGNVGRFHVQKNQLFLLEIIKKAVKLEPHCKLLLIGSGELEYEIRKRIYDYQLEKNVLLLSNRYDVNELYQAMDLFSLPSLYEGLPVSGIEAQASGLPCVFSDTITQKADITQNVIFCSLNEGAEFWAKSFLEYIHRFQRKDVFEKIKASGYDAQTEGKKLQQFYLSFYK